MRVALLGASGYIGSGFAHEIESRGHQLTRISRQDCDIYSADALTRFIDDASADIVINCAGYTGKPNVDACETDKANCLAGNATLPGVIAEACKRLGIAWGHVSSGCIYTGRRPDGGGFTEEDPPNFSFRQNNCSFYSGTKALGEELLSDADRVYIWRVRIPFSHVDSPRNYLSKLMRYDTLLEAENSLSNLDEFQAAALDCFELKLPYGIYNLTQPGSVWTSEVVALIKAAGLSDKQFRFFESEDQFLRTAAKTPRSNCVLDCSKAVAAGLRLTPIKESLQKALDNWISEPTK